MSELDDAGRRCRVAKSAPRWQSRASITMREADHLHGSGTSGDPARCATVIEPLRRFERRRVRRPREGPRVSREAVERFRAALG
jgi:hypothetical protein